MKREVYFLLGMVTFLCTVHCSYFSEIPEKYEVPYTPRIDGNIFDQGALVKNIGLCEVKREGRYVHSRGSGYLIDSIGIVQTAFHVIDECEEYLVQVNQYPDDIYLAKRISGNIMWDVGRLRITHKATVTYEAKEYILHDDIPAGVLRIKMDIKEGWATSSTAQDILYIGVTREVLDVNKRFQYVEQLETRRPAIGANILLEGYSGDCTMYVFTG